MTTISTSTAHGGGRVTRHDGPSHLVISQHPVLRRFWYAACFSSDVAGAPVIFAVIWPD